MRRLTLPRKALEGSMFAECTASKRGLVGGIVPLENGNSEEILVLMNLARPFCKGSSIVSEFLISFAMVERGE